MTSTISDRDWRTETRRMGDAARDRGAYLTAAQLYERVIALGDDSPGMSMAAGHMRKEAKDFASAEAHYGRVLDAAPNDPEIHLQLGHFYKTVGRYRDAEASYASALRLGHFAEEEVQAELAALRASGAWRSEVATARPKEPPDGEGLIADRLLPKRLEEIQRVYEETFVVSRAGNRQKTRWGAERTVRGVDALRGHIISARPCRSIDIFLDDELIHTAPLQMVPLRWRHRDTELRKYVFNAWIDFSRRPRGRYDLVMRASPLEGDPRRGIEWTRMTVVVADPIPEEECAGSPAFIPDLDPGSPLSVVDQVNSLPSIARSVTAGSYPGKLDTVAVLRLDQLGDMVVTLPAMRRLREILPQSRIVGLVGPGNAGLAATFGIFDDVVPIHFPDDRYQHKRVMGRREQAAFAETCRPYRFDLAIDFLYSEHASKLLPLTGAPITMTVARADHVEALEVAFDARAPSNGNCLSPMTHTAKARAVSEALALWLDNGARPLPRTLSIDEQLARYGLTPADRYVVLHTGSSFAHFLRWPHYPEVTRRFVDAGYKVVYMAADESDRAKLPAEATADGRIVYLAKKIPFDDLDALLTGAAMMIGNDSGPKHWADLRGTKVVSIHPGRDDYREWGQVFGGVVLARRVPCAGCGIRYDETECGQDFACVRKITVEEVLAAASRLLDEPLDTRSS